MEEEQVQCPNCGGYNVAVSKERIDPNTREIIPLCNFHTGTIFLLTIPALFGIAIILSGLSLAIVDIFITGIAISLIGLGILIFLGRLLDRSDGNNRREMLENTIEQSKYDCRLCNYKWQRAEGEPSPPVNVNPELMRLGAQRLAEEEEERQRRRRMGLQ